MFDEESFGYERPGGFGGTFGPILGALLGHMNDEQREEYLVPILRGTLWCQLMSEPGAGSDIGGITTRAERDGDEWVINGQKVWTTAGHLSDYGICLTRTDWDVPKYSGLTMFIVPMDTPGVSPRPLRQITGEAEFCETFLDDVRVPSRNVLGAPGGGWSVVQTWLTYEHGGVEEGDQSGPWHERGEGVDVARRGACSRRPRRGGAERGVADEPLVRDRLTRTFVADAVNGLVGRHLGIAMRDGRISGHAGSMVKVAAATAAQQSTAAGVDLPGMRGWRGTRSMVGDARGKAMLQTRSHSIAGGTNEVQRNNTETECSVCHASRPSIAVSRSEKCARTGPPRDSTPISRSARGPARNVRSPCSPCFIIRLWLARNAGRATGSRRRRSALFATTSSSNVARVPSGNSWIVQRRTLRGRP